MTLSFPNETSGYRQARNALLDAEISLRNQIEEIAKQRRALPAGGEIPENYEFTDMNGSSVSLSALFGDHTTLALYSYMFAPGDKKPCPACTSLVDGWSGQINQITQKIAFACVTAAPPDQMKSIISARGWDNVPFYSAQGTDYQRGYYGETPEGQQRTFMNIFVRDGSTIRHSWGSELERADVPGHPRHLDSTWPIWGLLDLTPDGRGDFFPEIFGQEWPDQT